MNIQKLLHPLSAIRAFEAVARLRSVSAAALDLGVTQPAISQQVRKLEAHLGVKLLERVSKGIRLSSQGEKLALHLHSAFRIMRDGMEEAMGQGQVTLAVLNSFAQRWLIPRMADLQEKYPDIDLRLIASSKLEDLERGGVDLVIAPRPEEERSGNRVFLMADDAWLVMAPDLQKRNPIEKPADLSKHILIRVEESPRDQDWKRWCGAAGLDDLQPQGWHTFSNSSHALEAAIAGVGVAIGHRPMVVDAMSSGRLVCPLDLKINQDVGNYILETPSLIENPQVALVKSWLVSQAYGG